MFCYYCLLTMFCNYEQSFVSKTNSQTKQLTNLNFERNVNTNYFKINNNLLDCFYFNCGHRCNKKMMLKD